MNINISIMERGIMNKVNEFINVLLQLQIENNISFQNLKKILQWNTLKVFQMHVFEILQMYLKWSRKYSTKNVFQIQIQNTLKYFK